VLAKTVTEWFSFVLDYKQ